MELREVLLKRRSVRKFTDEAVTENILLRVTDLGLGAVWCGIHPQKRSEERVKKILDIPNKQIPLNVIFIGYPAEEPEARSQYEEEKVHFL